MVRIVSWSVDAGIFACGQYVAAAAQVGRPTGKNPAITHGAGQQGHGWLQHNHEAQMIGTGQG
jgi:hypothetical protein